MIFKIIIQNSSSDICGEIALRLLQQNLTNEKSQHVSR